MHIVTATICLAGDTQQKVVKHAFDPISWPEVEVLRALHTENGVMDVKVIASVQQSVKDEKIRLSNKYGPEIVESVFPGRNPPMEMDAAGAKLPSPPVGWRNPLTLEYRDMPENEEVDDVPQAKAETLPSKARVLKPDHTPFA